MEMNQKDTENYSLLEGGFFGKLEAKTSLIIHQGLFALTGICFAWLPLVILTVAEGTFYEGSANPFLMDVAMHARLLIALPVLILIGNLINLKTTEVTRYLSESLLDKDDREKFLSVRLPFYRKLASSSLTKIVIMLIVVGSLLSLIQNGLYGGLQGDGTNWKFVGSPGDNVISLAGKWAVFVSLPFFQFISLLWLWRYIVWMMLLYRFSHLPLKLLPTHADRAGGLGILILAQRSFSLIFLAGSLVISGQLIVFIMNNPDDILAVARISIGYILLCLFLLMLPLLFFIGRMIKTKQRGLLNMSKLGIELSRTFERDWINEEPIEKRIAERQVDSSLAYDYSSMYDLLQQFRIVPVTLRDLTGLVVTLLIPFIPILFVYYSAAEVLEKIIGFLI